MDYTIYSINKDAYYSSMHQEKPEFCFYRLEDFEGTYDNSLYQIRFYLSEGQVTINEDSYLVAVNDVHIIKPNVVCNTVDAETSGYVFLFSDSFLDRVQMHCSSSLRNQLAIHAIPNVVHIRLELVSKLRSYIDLISEEIIHGDNLEAIEKMISIVFLYLFDCKNLAHIDSRFDSEKVCCLLKSIDENFKEHQHALFYSKLLSVSVRRMNELTTATLARTVTMLIQERIMLEAKREIILGRMSMKEIAFMLGYIDNAYFSRVFKKSTGISPSEFKQRYGKLSNSYGK